MYTFLTVSLKENNYKALDSKVVVINTIIQFFAIIRIAESLS